MIREKLDLYKNAKLVNNQVAQNPASPETQKIICLRNRSFIIINSLYTETVKQKNYFRFRRFLPILKYDSFRKGHCIKNR